MGLPSPSVTLTGTETYVTPALKTTVDPDPLALDTAVFAPPSATPGTTAAVETTAGTWNVLLDAAQCGG